MEWARDKKMVGRGGLLRKFRTGSSLPIYFLNLIEFDFDWDSWLTLRNAFEITDIRPQKSDCTSLAGFDDFNGSQSLWERSRNDYSGSLYFYEAFYPSTDCFLWPLQFLKILSSPNCLILMMTQLNHVLSYIAIEHLGALQMLGMIFQRLNDGSFLHDAFHFHHTFIIINQYTIGDEVKGLK